MKSILKKPTLPQDFFSDTNKSGKSIRFNIKQDLKQDKHSEHAEQKKGVSASVSRCTLRLSDPEMQRNFVEYLRQSTIKQSMIVFIFIAIITFLLVVVLYRKSNDEEEEDKNTFNLLTIHLGAISLTLGFTVFMSLKFSRLSEFIGTSVMLPTIVIVYMSYLGDWIEMD